MLFLQTVLMLTVFNYDSPSELKDRGEDKKLRELMGKIYHSSQVEARIAEVGL